MSQNEEYYIENDGDYFREISTNSFLAGIFFCKNKIEYFSEYSKLKDDFEKKYHVSVVGQEDLDVSIVVEGTSIRLIDDYSDIINFNGKIMDVRTYLYLLTTSEIREYFDIKEPKNNIFKNYWNYFFDKKNKRK